MMPKLILKTPTDGAVSGSFRDPAGFLFRRGGVLYRHVSHFAQSDYDRLMQSGLYDSLVETRSLVRHSERDTALAIAPGAYKIIEPAPIRYISYPYEWSFGQTKRAALSTLDIEARALKFGMSLKDASAFNIQFEGYRPIFIDTLSFEIYQEGTPWTAYRQFCEHFLGPLALMNYCDVRLSQLMRIHPDGIPLDLVSRLLPARSWLNVGVLLHIHLHAKSQKQFAGRAVQANSHRMGRTGRFGIIDSLRTTVSAFRWRPRGTPWADYYTTACIYRDDEQARKVELVGEFLRETGASTVWDLGANDGRFSRIAAAQGMHVIAFDIDPAAVEYNYRQCVEDKEPNVLPLVLNISNPTPGVGWENEERMSFLERGPADAVLALAIVHHLAIGNNLPFPRLAAFFARICRWLIIEFVPKSDPQVQKMLIVRKDIFDDYRQEAFELAFAGLFDIKRSAPIGATGRILYLMELLHI